MGVESLLIFILIGAIAGWLAGLIVRGYGFGLLGNIVVGIVGAFIGGWLLGALGLFPGGGILGSIIGATIGAVVLLLLIRLVRRAT
ncbi:MAG: GlsB/YeaQ/YmgE family stress response membrane protein [Caulobacteraceae bacterium]|nr:GlsB/YeaQ/YmgE family stress response membrane protein [Caulobacteraceae bacterium]